MFVQRLEKVRHQLELQGMDYLALVPGFNLRYLTGLNYHLMERPLIVFIPADGVKEPVVLIPELELPAWEQAAPFEALRFAWSDASGPERAMQQAADALGSVRRLAAEHLRMRLLEYELIRRYMPEVSVVKGETALSPVRLLKDPSEIEAHRRAIRVAETALGALIPTLTPGVTEREIAGELTSALLLGGGESLPFDPLVLSGPKSAMPHGTTGDRLVESGDILLIDFGTSVDGYQSDITRTFVVGGAPNEDLKRVHAAVLAANRAGRASARPGVACQEVDRAARRTIAEAGYAQGFIHRTGHGLGLDIHEDPSIVEGNEMPLEPGMVFTIEPGVYRAGWGGVRIEDDVLITQDGCQSLTTLDRTLRVVGS